MARVRFGMCGCGGISNLHADCLRTLEGEGVARLVAGVEPDADRREAWGRKYGVPVYASLDEMLASADLDAVTVTSPSGLHAGQVVTIANAKKHVLCEKPLDLHVAAADAAVAAAEHNGVWLGGVFQQRFAAGPAKAKRAIEQGLFGRIVSVHAETPWYRTQGYYDHDAWRGTWALDGGVLANQSPHMIDRLLWLGGELDEVLHAELRCGFERDIEAETVAAVTVRLAGGALGTITGTTLAYDGLPQRVLICGTEGSCAFAGDELVYFKTTTPFEETAGPAAMAAPGVGGGGAADPLSISDQGHLSNIRDFALAVRDNRPPAVTGHDARRVTRALEMIYRKAGVAAFQA